MAYPIREMGTPVDQNRLWWIEDEDGDCLMNNFESPHAAEKWLQEYLAGQEIPAAEPIRAPFCGYCHHRHSPTQDHYLG